MPRWRVHVFRCGLLVLIASGLMTAYAFLHTAGLDSDVQQGLDLVKWARRIFGPAIISALLCGFGRGSGRVFTVAMSLVLICSSYFVAFHF